MNATETLKDPETRAPRPTLAALLPTSPLSPMAETASAHEEAESTPALAPARKVRQAIAKTSEPREEATPLASEAKEKREREPRLQPMARKLADSANLLVQLAQREDARRLAEHHRVRAICNTIFGTGLTHLLRESPLLTPADKEFLKQLGYL